MINSFQKAKLIPYQMVHGKNDQLDQNGAVELDFNPETLTIRATSGQQIDRGKQSQQQVEYVGQSNRTLSFDAVFDTTRPSEGASGLLGQQLDVRKKTERIANFLQADKGNGQCVPRRVQFHWGDFHFSGLIQSYNEVLDYFSPGGVPLRAKLSIAITEQHPQHQKDAEGPSCQRRPPQTSDANALASINGLNSLFDLSLTGSFGFNAELDLDLSVSAEASAGVETGFAAELGLNADLAFSANAGIELDSQAAVEVFGEAALQAGLSADADLALTLKGSMQVGDSPVGAPPGPWAPDGPSPGTRAAELAARVNEVRASGGVELRAPRSAGQFSATSLEERPQDLSAPAAEVRGVPGGVQVVATVQVGDLPVHPPVSPLPVRGSPPLVASRFGPPPPTGILSRRGSDPFTPPARRRPAWERLPSDE